MSKRMIAAIAALAFSAGAALAQEIKVGVVLPYTGIGAEFAQQMDRGMELYLKLNADQVKPYTITLIKRDSKAPNGAEAKVAVQELLTQDKVDALAGWVYSPDAIASAPVIAAGKKLAVIMNAGTAFITNLAPEYVRTSFTMWHSGYAMGVAAAKTLHAKTAVVAYTDFPPGKDSLEAFKHGFEANGGKVIDAIPAGGPGAVPDFTPFFQRAKDEKPDVLFVFVPAGDHASRGGQDLRRARHARGRHQADRTRRHHPGHQAAGHGRRRGRPHHHAPLQRRPRQSARTSASSPPGRRTTAPIRRPTSRRSAPTTAWPRSFTPCRPPRARWTATQAVKSLLGWKFDSPQGPIMIDPETRDIVMNEYLDEVVKGSDGKLHQKVIGQIDHVKDQCKELAIGPCAPKK